MNWDSFCIFASASIVLSFAGAAVSLLMPCRDRLASALFGSGAAVLAVFITGMWISLERPPMRTMGETRLWYSFFVSLTGLFVYRRWRFRWILLFAAVLLSVFNIINIFKPEIHDKTLVPALQSIWFIPHVTVYMMAYGILACAFILAVAGVASKKHLHLESMDNLVYIGCGLLFVGMFLGAVWAKQAWGDFWEWDPKETWAAVTCAAYLSYIHLRLLGVSGKKACIPVIVGFLLLQMCWYGYQYLPSSENSMHLYNILK